MPRVILHPNPAQPESCLESLLKYAQEISRTTFARSFSSVAGVADWIRMQPVKLDQGEAPQRQGCSPTQRGRIWPLDGLNCWEATAHFVGVALALQIPEVVHVYDVTRGGMRHVWPELQDALQLKNPVPIVLQRAVGSGPRAQAWYNTVADVAHGLGGTVLNLFGAEGLTPVVDSLWSLAPAEYGLSKNKPPEPPPPGTAPPAAPAPSGNPAAPFGGMPNPFTGTAPPAPYGYPPAPYGYPPSPYGPPVAFAGAPNPFSGSPPPPVPYAPSATPPATPPAARSDLLASLRSLLNSEEGSQSSNPSLQSLLRQLSAS
jgi:hypothetical protein